MECIKQVFRAVFLVFFRIGESSWSSETNAAKAVAGTTWVQSMLLLGLICWLYKITGDRILVTVPSAVIVALFLLTCIANYYLLVVRGIGVEFIVQFRTFDRRKRLLLLAEGSAFVVLSAAFALTSAYYVRLWS